jgi:tetratricopeptide (TPR) repeat protein
VDLWAANDVHFLLPATSQHPINLKLHNDPFYAAYIGPEELIAVLFPKGLDDAIRRFPRLRFQFGLSDSFMLPYLGHGIERLRDSVATHPGDDLARRDLAAFLLARGEFAEALAVYHEVLMRTPDDDRALLDSALCLHRMNRDPEARPLIERLLAVGIERADESLVQRARGLLDQL